MILRLLAIIRIPEERKEELLERAGEAYHRHMSSFEGYVQSAIEGERQVELNGA